MCSVALDVLVTLSYYHKQLEEFDKDLPLKIMAALCHTTTKVRTAKYNTVPCELKPEEGPEYTSRSVFIFASDRSDRSRGVTY